MNLPLPLQKAASALANAEPGSPLGRLKRLAAFVAMLLFVSAVWVETDVYRGAGLVMAAWAHLAYFVATERVRVGWMGALCLAWAAFTFCWFLWIYLSGSTTSLGSSEGIYLFPLFYMALGYFLVAYRSLLGPASLAFLYISLALAVISVDLVGAFDGDFHDFFFTNNRIHGSINGGFVILAAIAIAAHAARTQTDARSRVLVEVAAALTIALCVVGLFGAKSKGVWAAIGIAFCLQVALSVRDLSGRRSRLSLLLMVVGCAAFVAAFHKPIWAIAGPSLDGLAETLWKAAWSDDPAAAIRQAIETEAVPRGTYLRLMLWYNAFEVWSHNVLFGTGVGWRDLFYRTRYSDVGFNVVHNGYLEIGMRYGLVGLAFFGAVFAWSIAAARRARNRGLIAPEAFTLHVAAMVFFLITLATNSNNRLAIGETYMTLVGAFGFYCLFACQLEHVSRKREPVSRQGHAQSNS